VYAGTCDSDYAYRMLDRSGISPLQPIGCARGGGVLNFTSVLLCRVCLFTGGMSTTAKEALCHRIRGLLKRVQSFLSHLCIHSVKSLAGFVGGIAVW
jgi:hypothetical protein